MLKGVKEKEDRMGWPRDGGIMNHLEDSRVLLPKEMSMLGA